MHIIMFALELVGGKVIAEDPIPAVPSSLIAEICKWREEGASLADIVCRLRERTVPNGFRFNTWIPG